MRNLLEYPITDEEIESCVDSIHDNLNSVAFGNLDRTILLFLLEYYEVRGDVSKLTGVRQYIEGIKNEGNLPFMPIAPDIN